MRDAILLIILGVALGIPLGMKITSGAYDSFERKLKEQYRDCANVGEYPTDADMQSEGTW